MSCTPYEWSMCLVVNVKLNEKGADLYRYNPRKEWRGGKWITYSTVISELQLAVVQIHACLGL